MSSGSTVFPANLDSNSEVDNTTEIASGLFNSHSVQIEALQEKVGKDSSADTNSLDYKLSDTGIKLIIGNLLMPVGFIYTSYVATNPADLFGFGTWVLTAQGEALVGYKSADTPFGTVGSIGTAGEKTHQLSTAELATHTHTQDAHGHTQNAHSHGVGAAYRTGASSDWWTVNSSDPYIKDGMGERNTDNATATNQNTTATNQNAGSGTAHNNIQPSFVIYIFRRTA